MLKYKANLKQNSRRNSQALKKNWSNPDYPISRFQWANLETLLRIDKQPIKEQQLLYIFINKT